jgi:hypothetical protein
MRSPRRRGRPTKQTTTMLMNALIARQLALAQRRAREINEILASHVHAGDEARLWLRVVARARKTMVEDLPLRVAQALPNHPGLPAVVKQLAGEAVEELRITDRDRELAALPSPPREPRAVVPSPENYAHSRAISAGLSARLMRLRARIAHPGRSQ